jgi:hypothetical protein
MRVPAGRSGPGGMSSDWYARKLARFRQESPPPPQSQPQAYQGHSTVWPQQLAPQRSYNNLPVPDTPPNGATNIANFFDMTRLWKGGKAHRIDPDPCPECGSPQFYSRTEGNLRGPPPAPHCYNCGYNGIFTQGLSSSWATQ